MQTHPTARRSRKRPRYDGRQWGSGPTRAPAKPNVRQEAAEQALTDVLELFGDPERLPTAIAQTVIARLEGTSPMVYWSLPNQLLCICAGSVDCRGIRQWNEVGRKVKKGSRCVRILAPRTRKIRDTDKATGDESERTLTVGFIGVPVFRYCDTEGAPLEQPDYEPTELPPLFEVAERLGVNVIYAPCLGRFRGYYHPGREEIILCSHDARTWFHEVSHAAHARVLRSRGEALQGGQNARAEIVAEVVAATLCRLFDLSGYLPHSRDYVDHYAGQGGPARATLKVLGDVQAVLEILLWSEAAEPMAVAA